MISRYSVPITDERRLPKPSASGHAEPPARRVRVQQSWQRVAMAMGKWMVGAVIKNEMQR